MRNNGSGTLSYNSNGYYVIYNNVNGSQSFIPITALNNQKPNFTIEWDSNTPSMGTNNGFVVYKDDNNWCDLIQDSNGYIFQGIKLNGSFSESNQSISVSNNIWLHTKIVLNGTNFIYTLSKSDGTIIGTRSITMNSVMNNSVNKYGFSIGWNGSVSQYIKNIKAYSN